MSHASSASSPRISRPAPATDPDRVGLTAARWDDSAARGSDDGAGDPRALVRDVLLRDGSTLRLQAPTPADFEDLKAFYDGLSAESRYLRFHGQGRSEVAARADVEAAGVDRQALIARYRGRVVAVASFDGLREPCVAEASFAVADDLQRRGVGTRLLEQLAAIAAARGIRRFDAEVLAANPTMLGVFQHAGFAVRRRGSYGEVTISLDITPTNELLERIDERDHRAAIASLRPVLAPTSVAVVGAESTPGNVGRRVLANILSGDFQGVVAPVNPAGGVVCSMPAARTLAELPVAPELVIIAVPGPALLDAAAEAATSGARALLVLPSGPEDAGASAAGEAELVEIVRGAGLRLVGPGSLGVINTAAEVGLNATFTDAEVHAGAVAICAQTSAPGLGLIGHAAARGLGISMVGSLGCRADVSTNDMLEWLEEDERTRVVMLYVESFGHPQHFARIARRVSRTKPILAIKARRETERSGAEACSHTAAALRGEAITDALLHQAGVLRFRGRQEVFDATDFFISQPLPRGRRVGMVSNSAGPATLADDACRARGLEIADAGRTSGPPLLGVSAGPEEYAASVRALLDDHGIDAVMVIYVDLFGQAEAVLDAVCSASVDQRKPVVASIVRCDGRLAQRSAATVPNYLYTESCAAVLACAARRREWLSRRLGERPRYHDVDAAAARARVGEFLAREPGGGWLTPGEAHALLRTHGIPVARSSRCHDLTDAIAAATSFGGPVALIADSPTPAQASDIEAMVVGLEGPAAIRAGWRQLHARARANGRQWTGAIVRPLPAGGADLLVGTIVDPNVGPVIAVGLGGPHAGADPTTAFGLPPETDAEADELIDAATSVADELDRFRGPAALDRPALRDLVLRFALLVAESPQIVEADLNPVRCTTRGCIVLDMRIRAEDRSPPQRVKTW